MAKFPDLYVLRHGQTEWNLAGRYQGRLDSELTKQGRQHALDQGAILGGLNIPDLSTNCFTSPQGRAVATAEIALTPLGYSATPDQRLMEVAFGDWQGMTQTEITAGWPDLDMTGPSKSWYMMAPNGESTAQIKARVRAFLADLTGPAIVVTHSFTSIILRGLWMGLGQTEMLSLPHLQGCVYHLSAGQEKCLTLKG